MYNRPTTRIQWLCVALSSSLCLCALAGAIPQAGTSWAPTATSNWQRSKASRSPESFFTTNTARSSRKPGGQQPSRASRSTPATPSAACQTGQQLPEAPVHRRTAKSFTMAPTSLPTSRGFIAPLASSSPMAGSRPTSTSWSSTSRRGVNLASRAARRSRLFSPLRPRRKISCGSPST